MILQLDLSSTIPFYVQIRNQIVLWISSGELPAGEGLPTVRQLAEDLGVNTMTVSKAYTLTPWRRSPSRNPSVFKRV